MPGRQGRALSAFAGTIDRETSVFGPAYIVVYPCLYLSIRLAVIGFEQWISVERSRVMARVFALALLILGLGITSLAQTGTPTLFQKPTVNRSHIVFVYAGDLWIVPREGGDAKRLTTGVGIETDPVFS